MSWLTGEWSAAFRIVGQRRKQWYSDCQDGPGIYRLIGLRNRFLPHPAILNRVCGQDKTGTIYIGAAKTSLKRRLGHLVMNHNSKYLTKAHKAFPLKLKEAFPEVRLAFCWQYASTKEEALAKEWDLLQRYKAEFGEAPPLNGQG